MSNPSMLDQDRSAAPDPQPTNEPNESFGEILSQYEQSHTHRTRTEEGGKQLEGTVVAVTGDQVFLDIGYKIEGTIPVAEFTASGAPIGLAHGYQIGYTHAARGFGFTPNLTV